MESFDQTWELVLDICRNKITNIAFETWLTKITPSEFNLDKKKITLVVPNSFYKKTIESCYKPLLEEAFEQIFGIEFSVEISCIQENTKKEVSKNFSEAFSFDNFVVGPSNKFAHWKNSSFVCNPKLFGKDSAGNYFGVC